VKNLFYWLLFILKFAYFSLSLEGTFVMLTPTQGSETLPNRLFGIFCLASFLLSMSYGTTFLLALMLGAHGGSEADAGTVISIGMLGTFVAVIMSGHLSDLLGAPKAIAISAVMLAIACLGFVLTPGYGVLLLAFGLVLGFGWGLFYTLGPIIVTMIIVPSHRVKYFALLSGSMMSGIGAGPLVGRAATALEGAVDGAFYVAAAASLLGGALFYLLGPRIKAQQARLGTVVVCKISARTARRVVGSRAMFAIVMVGLGGCIFGGLSSFQTTYAAAHGLDYSLFFLGFICSVITCRLLVAGFVVKRDAYVSVCVLTALTVLSLLLFIFAVDSTLTYLLAASVLGVGYGLTYSVINGLAANEAPAGLTSQALVLFSLAYFVGIFGFPLLAGAIIVQYGIGALLFTLLALAIGNWLITVGRLLHRRRSGFTRETASTAV
jgi:MFS family permease